MIGPTGVLALLLVTAPPSGPMLGTPDGLPMGGTQPAGYAGSLDAPRIGEVVGRVGDDEGGYDSVKRVFESATYVSSMNLLGLPVGIAPIGMHDTSPISVQLIGPRYREDLCLDAAAVIEAEVGILVEELWAR